MVRSSSTSVVVSRTSEQLTLRATTVAPGTLLRNIVVAVIAAPGLAMGCALIARGNATFLLALVIIAVVLALALAVVQATSRVVVVVERGRDLVVTDGLLSPTTTALPASAVRQVFCRAHSWVENEGLDRRNKQSVRVQGAQLMAQTVDGRDHVLAAGLLRPATAKAFEGEIERFLGLVDVKMTGAL